MNINLRELHSVLKHYNYNINRALYSNYISKQEKLMNKDPNYEKFILKYKQEEPELDFQDEVNDIEIELDTE